MSLFNSMIFKMIMGHKDNKEDPNSPFDKYKVDAEDNPFGTSSSDPTVNYLLQGGENPKFSLNDYGKGFFNGGGMEQEQNLVPLSALTGSQVGNMDAQPLYRKYSTMGNNFSLSGLR